MTGYLHPYYANSLAEFGEPLLLQRSGGWLLKRSIDGTAVDAMGIYPLFLCSDWTGLETDFRQISESLVSVVVVTDPFGEYNEALLRDRFTDLVAPFKSHFIVDLCSAQNAISHHHARNVRIGLNQIGVERCVDPSAYLDDWVRLYAALIARHTISGIRAFSRSSFAMQLKTPGLECFRAFRDHQTVGMILWYVQRDIAYYHLGAYTHEAYQLRASYALFRNALDYFAGCGLKYVNLGAGAGLDGASDEGLTRFKRGWASDVRTTYLCGRIFNRDKYDDLVRTRRIELTDYFPAYRVGEFN